MLKTYSVLLLAVTGFSLNAATLPERINHRKNLIEAITKHFAAYASSESKQNSENVDAKQTFGHGKSKRKARCCKELCRFIKAKFACGHTTPITPEMIGTAGYTMNTSR